METGSTSGRRTPRPAARRVVAVLGTLGAVAATGAALTLAVTTTAARVLVTPVRRRPDDAHVIAVEPGRITLRADALSTAVGRYGLWQDQCRGHVRVGGVLEHEPATGRVVRELLGVDRGSPRPGPARWNQYYFSGDPLTAVGLEFTDVDLPGPLGALPTWFVPAGPATAPGVHEDEWAVLVHGYGATREETLRALPVLHRLGVPALVPTYRNDVGAQGPARGKYHLGDTEWGDVEVAVQYALDHGARSVVIFGWSMGGAVALQTVSRSRLAPAVRALVLDGPVVDWRDVLRHQSAVLRVPPLLTRLTQRLLESPRLRVLAGTERPISFDRLDWTRRAGDLAVPVLLVHSDDDDFVPPGPSRALAEARPDLVTFVPARDAGHTREWNVDPDAWETAVAGFMRRR